MANLPVEVLQLIFPLLVNQDKLECMTVCRQWKYVANHSLFRVIYLDSPEKLNRLIERVEEEPTLGATTKRLILKLTLDEDFDDAILFQLFPNVRDFTLINKGSVLPAEKPAKVRDSHAWCQHMEKMVENLPFSNTKSLLHSGLCKNLTFLALLARDEQPGEGQELIEAVRNAPALTTLKLRAYEFTFDEFDCLPELLPFLSSIHLLECYIDFSSLPARIKPATAIKSFRSVLSDGDTYINDNNYVKYISQKYLNVEDLGFESRMFSDENQDELVSAAEHKEVMTSYLKKLGPRLKTLTVDLQTWDYDFTPGFDFDVLDKSGCQINKLVLSAPTFPSMLERLARTDQTRYIQSLDIKEIAFERRNISKVISYTWLAHFTALKELSLKFDITITERPSYKLKLPELLDALAETQVETLRIRCAQLNFATSGTIRTYPSIKDLHIGFCDFKLNADTVISQSMPNLKYLTIDGCWRSQRTFAFPKSNLSYFQVSNVHTTEPLHVLLITLDDNQQRMYSTYSKPLATGLGLDSARYDPSSFPPISCRPYADSNVTPHITITCKSVSNFFIAATEH